MHPTSSTVKKLDIYWTLFSIVFLLITLFLWQTGKDYVLLLMFVPIGITMSIKQLIPNTLFTILRVIFTLAMLFVIIKLLV